MKKVIVVISIVLFFSSCTKKHRYTQDSKQIDIVKATIDYYDFQQWDSLPYSYADTAKIYYNSRKIIMSPNDLKAYFTRNSESFSTRAFENERREYEMIEDNNGNVWVNFWGIWEGNLKANNKKVVIPVHITYQFVDNKIVTEYGYWNTEELNDELKKIAAQEPKTEEVETEIKIEDIEEVEEEIE